MKIAVVEGDGIGREVVPAAMHVLDTLGINAEKVPVEVGYGKWERTGSAITEQDIDTMKDCDCVFFGAITSPPDPGYRSALVHIRKELDLYANIRPFKPLKYLNLPCSSKEFDFIIVRENTEGMYSGIERIEENAAYSTRVVTRKGSERIARKACELAAKRAKKITIVHKANVLKSCTLFREVCIRTAKECGMEHNEMLVDAMAYNLIINPQRFDVVVTTNLFGDILSDLGAALVGGLGMCPSANIGGKWALFEPVHGSAPDIAGKDIANPIAAILSLKMMLDWFKMKEAPLVEKAVNRALAEGIVTRDLGGKYSTREVAEAIARFAISG